MLRGRTLYEVKYESKKVKFFKNFKYFSNECIYEQDFCCIKCFEQFRMHYALGSSLGLHPGTKLIVAYIPIWGIKVKNENVWKL